ncbi:MAG: heavy metal translocating P-type ATPase [Candidatus Bathyarchaeota archaeon]|nr:heavy metal translocating P-type ATPase [Candidatus Bathyarchaeota archaeon]
MTKQKSRLKISGMACAACAQTIEKALLKTEGVDKALVNFATETAHIEYDDKITNEKRLTEIIKDTGYDVDGGTQRITLRIGGMTCASCAQTIENALRKTEGMHAKTWRGS